MRPSLLGHPLPLSNGSRQCAQRVFPPKIRSLSVRGCLLAIVVPFGNLLRLGDRSDAPAVARQSGVANIDDQRSSMPCQRRELSEEPRGLPGHFSSGVLPSDSGPVCYPQEPQQPQLAPVQLEQHPHPAAMTTFFRRVLKHQNCYSFLTGKVSLSRVNFAGLPLSTP